VWRIYEGRYWTWRFFEGQYNYGVSLKVVVVLVKTEVFYAAVTLQLGGLSEQERETEALDSEVKLCQFGIL